MLHYPKINLKYEHQNNLGSCHLTCLKISSLLEIKFDHLVLLNLCFLLPYSEDNDIGSIGAKILSKFQLPKL